MEQRAPERCVSVGAVHQLADSENLQSPDRSLRTRGHHLEHYYDWLLDHAFQLVPAQPMSVSFLATFKFSAAAEGGELQHG